MKNGKFKTFLRGAYSVIETLMAVAFNKYSLLLVAAAFVLSGAYTLWFTDIYEYGAHAAVLVVIGGVLGSILLFKFTDVPNGGDELGFALFAPIGSLFAIFLVATPMMKIMDSTVYPNPPIVTIHKNVTFIEADKKALDNTSNSLIPAINSNNWHEAKLMYVEDKVFITKIYNGHDWGDFKKVKYELIPCPKAPTLKALTLKAKEVK